jgi:two-component system, response regulator PdtaR
VNDLPANVVALVVEDEWLLRLELVDELRREGWLVLEAGSGEEALEFLENDERIDFLITDIRLSGAVDGWDVAERWRERDPILPVIYVSANPSVEARRVKDSVFLGKPVYMHVLIDICRSMSRVTTVK